MPYSNISDLRAARDQALSNSDFYLLEDSPIVEELRDVKMVALKLYRQELRDLPAKASIEGIENVELPTSPM
tara:strand:- start:2012 stop:2227 length:216 start_codon:yes stop_codon:yes gene_type:complete